MLYDELGHVIHHGVMCHDWTGFYGGNPKISILSCWLCLLKNSYWNFKQIPYPPKSQMLQFQPPLLPKTIWIASQDLIQGSPCIDKQKNDRIILLLSTELVMWIGHRKEFQRKDKRWVVWQSNGYGDWKTSRQTW